MGTRKNRKSKQINNRFRKSRSKKQKGSGANCSRPGQCTTDQINIEDEDPNEIHEYLVMAIEDETPEYVKEYLDKGANPNILILDEHLHLPEDVRVRLEPELVPASIYAARHIQPSTILEYLVMNKGAFLEPYLGTTLLIEAAEYGNLHAVRYLLSKKDVDINATTGSGVPAIAYAVLNEDIPMIRLMLDKRKGEIDFNYKIQYIDNEDVITYSPENVINDAANREDPEVAIILKEYANKIKHKNMRDVRFVMEKGKNKDGRPLLPRARRDVASMVGEFLGGKRKTRKTRKNHRNKK
jgi:ankyrin repeat protein